MYVHNKKLYKCVAWGFVCIFYSSRLMELFTSLKKLIKPIFFLHVIEPERCR